MTEQCSVCMSEDISEMGREFSHFEGVNDYRKSVVGEKVDIPDVTKSHVMCDTCLKDFVRVCTCDKEFRDEPKTISLLCSCTDKDGNMQRVYFDINHQHFLGLLSHWSGDYHIIEGCRGCRYSTKDIQTNFKIGLKAAVEACVYKQADIDKNDMKFSAMTYESDALDEDFVKAYSQVCKDFGIENILGEATDI